MIHNLAGLFVTLATCLGTYCCVGLLLDWDNPDRPRDDYSRASHGWLFEDSPGA